MAKKMDEVQQDIIDFYLEKFDADFPVAMEHATDIMLQEAKKMYDAMITQFYKYHTTSYIRHWEGRPGTEKGTNLYYAAMVGRGKNIKKKYSYGVPYLDIDINASEMDGGYQYHSKEKVLEYIITGTRFINKGKRAVWIPWNGKYIGKYFQFQGTIEHAFAMFLDHYEKIATPIFMNKWRSLGWK